MDARFSVAHSRSKVFLAISEVESGGVPVTKNIRCLRRRHLAVYIGTHRFAVKNESLFTAAS